MQNWSQQSQPFWCDLGGLPTLWHNTNTDIYLKDLTNSISKDYQTGLGAGWHKFSAWWNSTSGKMNAAFDGTLISGTDGDFDGTMDHRFSYIGVGYNPGCPTWIRVLKIWNKVKDNTWAQSETS
jgi:hypothetical protein